MAYSTNKLNVTLVFDACSTRSANRKLRSKPGATSSSEFTTVCRRHVRSLAMCLTRYQSRL